RLRDVAPPGLGLECGHGNREGNTARIIMRLTIWVAGVCAAAIVALACASAPAEAAAKKRVLVRPDRTERITVIDEYGRARTRITVAPRSFLDAGTEVAPGDRKFTDYALPPYHYPLSIIDNKGGYHRSPLPGPFDLPGWQPW